MTAPVTVSERDLRVLLGIVSDRRRDIPDAGLPPSLLAEPSDQVRCDNVSVFNADFGYCPERLAVSFMQEVPPMDCNGVDVQASDWYNWPEYTCYPERTGDLRSVTKVSDFYSARQWHSTAAHTDCFRRLDVEHVLMLCLPGPGPAAWPDQGIKLAVFRGPGPDFSDRDLALLALLRPHLRQAWFDVERRRRGEPQLTRRHRELLRLVAAGHTNGQIARRLGISERTVRTHLENIYNRLQVSSRTAAITRAFAGDTAE